MSYSMEHEPAHLLIYRAEADDSMVSVVRCGRCGYEMVVPADSEPPQGMACPACGLKALIGFSVTWTKQSDTLENER